MSEQNVEIVRSFYRAWAHDDLPGPVELMDPEIEYVNPAKAVEPGTRRGVAAFAAAVVSIASPSDCRAAGALLGRRRRIRGVSRIFDGRAVGSPAPAPATGADNPSAPVARQNGGKLR